MRDCDSCGTINPLDTIDCWGCGRPMSSEAVPKLASTPAPAPKPALKPTPTPAPAPKPAPAPTGGPLKCAACGTDNPAGADQCWGCGAAVEARLEPPLGVALCLVAENGRTFSFNIKMRLNQHWARVLGEGARFWDRSWQMEFVKRDDRWHLIPNPNTANDTLLNGKLVETEASLDVGDVVAVGRASKGVVHTRLTVSRPELVPPEI